MDNDSRSYSNSLPYIHICHIPSPQPRSSKVLELHLTQHVIVFQPIRVAHLSVSIESLHESRVNDSTVDGLEIWQAQLKLGTSPHNI